MARQNGKEPSEKKSLRAGSKKKPVPGRLQFSVLTTRIRREERSELMIPKERRRRRRSNQTPRTESSSTIRSQNMRILPILSKPFYLMPSSAFFCRFRAEEAFKIFKSWQQVRGVEEEGCYTTTGHKRRRFRGFPKEEQTTKVCLQTNSCESTIKPSE